MKLYRFSPINDNSQLDVALRYVARQAPLLSERVLGQRLSIDTLAIFSHYLIEHDALESLLRARGPESKIATSSDRHFYVDVEAQIEGQQIRWLGLRIPDPYRMQVGYGDYSADYNTIAREHLGKNPYIRKLENNLTMLELWHPDFDILGYIVKE